MSIIESKYPVLILSFNNCDICCCHLDGYGNNKEALLDRLLQIEAFFKKNARYRIWYNIDDSILNDEIIGRIVQSVLLYKDQIIKIAFIGLKAKKRVFDKAIKKNLANKELVKAYFSDAELAKEWLAK